MDWFDILQFVLLAVGAVVALRLFRRQSSSLDRIADALELREPTLRRGGGRYEQPFTELHGKLGPRTVELRLRGKSRLELAIALRPGALPRALQLEPVSQRPITTDHDVQVGDRVLDQSFRIDSHDHDAVLALFDDGAAREALKGLLHSYPSLSLVGEELRIQGLKPRVDQVRACLQQAIATCKVLEAAARPASARTDARPEASVVDTAAMTADPTRSSPPTLAAPGSAPRAPVTTQDSWAREVKQIYARHRRLALMLGFPLMALGPLLGLAAVFLFGQHVPPSLAAYVFVPTLVLPVIVGAAIFSHHLRCPACGHSMLRSSRPTTVNTTRCPSCGIRLR